LKGEQRVPQHLSPQRSVMHPLPVPQWALLLHEEPQ